MALSRKETLVDLFQHWGVVVTSHHATGTPVQNLQDLAEFIIKALVERGDLSAM